MTTTEARWRARGPDLPIPSPRVPSATPLPVLTLDATAEELPCEAAPPPPATSAGSAPAVPLEPRSIERSFGIVNLGARRVRVHGVSVAGWPCYAGGVEVVMLGTGGKAAAPSSLASAGGECPSRCASTRVHHPHHAAVHAGLHRRGAHVEAHAAHGRGRHLGAHFRDPPAGVLPTCVAERRAREASQPDEQQKRTACATVVLAADFIQLVVTELMREAAGEVGTCGGHQRPPPAAGQGEPPPRHCSSCNSRRRRRRRRRRQRRGAKAAAGGKRGSEAGSPRATRGQRRRSRP